MYIVAIVPMKLNSTRLPNKNIRSFHNGAPLCHYVLATLLSIKKEGVLDDIYVYCSNPEIQEYIPEGVNYLHRSESLDRDCTHINEVLAAFSADVNADIYVQTHATAPFISQTSIKTGIQAVRDGAYDSAFAVKKIQDFLWRAGRPFNYQLDNIPRTQDLPELMEETGGFYIYRRNVIVEMSRRIGVNPCLIEVSEIESIDIDEAEDFEIADAVYNYRSLQINQNSRGYS